MSKKTILKLTVDFSMTVLLLLLMAYSLLGEEVHEWLGLAMLILLLAHHTLNAGWIKNLGKGRYQPYRIVQTVLVVLALLAMLGTMISGVILSRYLFAFLPIVGGQEAARLTHLLCSYWSFLLMSLHLGIHWNMISGILRRVSAAKRPECCTIVFRIIAAFVVVYGVIGFFRQDILSYLLLKTHFVFIDFDRPLLLFFADYFAMMGLFVFFGFCGGKVAVRLSVRRSKADDNSSKRRQTHE